MDSEAAGTVPIVEQTKTSSANTGKHPETAVSKNAQVLEEFDWHPSSKRRELSEMDLTPMVDLTFLLNMFFILTTSYALMQTIQIAPVAERKEKGNDVAVLAPSATHIIVKIDADNVLTVDDQVTRYEDLATRLLDARIATGKNMLIVDSDANAEVNSMVQVIDAAATAKMEKVKMPSNLRNSAKE